MEFEVFSGGNFNENELSELNKEIILHNTDKDIVSLALYFIAMNDLYLYYNFDITKYWISFEINNNKESNIQNNKNKIIDIIRSLTIPILIKNLGSINAITENIDTIYISSYGSNGSNEINWHLLYGTIVFLDYYIKNNESKIYYVKSVPNQISNLIITESNNEIRDILDIPSRQSTSPITSFISFLSGKNTSPSLKLSSAEEYILKDYLIKHQIVYKSLNISENIINIDDKFKHINIYLIAAFINNVIKFEGDKFIYSNEEPVINNELKIVYGNKKLSIGEESLTGRKYNLEFK